MKSFRRDIRSAMFTPKIKIYQCHCQICKYQPHELKKWIIRNPYSTSLVSLKNSFAECIAEIPKPVRVK